MYVCMRVCALIPSPLYSSLISLHTATMGKGALLSSNSPPTYSGWKTTRNEDPPMRFIEDERVTAKFLNSAALKVKNLGVMKTLVRYCVFFAVRLRAREGVNICNPRSGSTLLPPLPPPHLSSHMFCPLYFLTVPPFSSLTLPSFSSSSTIPQTSLQTSSPFVLVETFHLPTSERYVKGLGKGALWDTDFLGRLWKSLIHSCVMSIYFLGGSGGGDGEGHRNGTGRMAVSESAPPYISSMIWPFVTLTLSPPGPSPRS